MPGILCAFLAGLASERQFYDDRRFCGQHGIRTGALYCFADPESGPWVGVAPVLFPEADIQKERISEKLLQKLILEDIESFMKELGNNFCFIGSEYKIKIGNNYNFIDLLLFNYEYNCFVVIELKVTELKKEHIGQIEVYMNYIDKNVKKINHDSTIGIIICRKDNKFVMEYCSDKRILAKEYKLV